MNTTEEKLLRELNDAVKPEGPTTQTNYLLYVIAKALIEIAAQLEVQRLDS